MLSSSTQRALDCASCRHPGAVVECAQCEASLCLQCAQDRHRRGTLAVHTFKLVPSDADAASSPLLMRVGAPCSYCDNRPSVLFCPTCSLIFCGACATSFHSIGSLVAHVASYSDKVNVADPGKFNGDSSALIDTALQPTDVITLKIGAFGIAVTVERLEHIMEKPLSHFLAINCESQTLRLYCKGDESQTYEFSRPFDDLLNASVNADHPSCISIQFKSFSMQADVMMIREAEGRQVVQLVNQIRKKQCAFNIKPIDSLGDNIVTFKGFAHKKGKVTWSLRHLIVSGHFLYVYRDVTADMPLNSIDLLGSPAFKTSSKQLSIGTTDRQFVFRLKSKMQTDILNAVLQHCHGIIENADTTHNLVNKVTAMPASDNARMPTANVRLSTARSSVSPSPHAPRFRRTTSQTATNLFARSPTECLPREAQAIQLEDELQKIRLGFSSAAGQRHPPVNQDGVKADLADCLVAANAALPSMGDGLSMRNNGNDVLPLLLLLAESMEHGASFTGELFVRVVHNDGTAMLTTVLPDTVVAVVAERRGQAAGVRRQEGELRYSQRKTGTPGGRRRPGPGRSQGTGGPRRGPRPDSDDNVAAHPVYSCCEEADQTDQDEHGEAGSQDQEIRSLRGEEGHQGDVGQPESVGSNRLQPDGTGDCIDGDRVEQPRRASVPGRAGRRPRRGPGARQRLLPRRALLRHRRGPADRDAPAHQTGNAGAAQPIGRASVTRVLQLAPCLDRPKGARNGCPAYVGHECR